MAKRRPYQFTKKKHSKRGICAFAVAVLLFALFWCLIALAFGSEGTLPSYYGSIGLFALLFTVADLVFSLCIMGDDQFFPLYPRLAATVSGLSLLCWVGVYAIGFLL
ncbi:MAG: DUF6142 family protein [Clostridiales bacterium]|nr:DUF6142 family protein [Clostridiales bacterium]